MIKKNIIQKEVIERHKFCDVCGAEIYIGLTCSIAKCEYCKKDLCEKDIDYEEENGSDYRTVWCKKCWELGEQYRTQIEKLHSKIEELYIEWQNMCK